MPKSLHNQEWSVLFPCRRGPSMSGVVFFFCALAPSHAGASLFGSGHGGCINFCLPVMLMSVDMKSSMWDSDLLDLWVWSDLRVSLLLDGSLTWALHQSAPMWLGCPVFWWVSLFLELAPIGLGSPLRIVPVSHLAVLPSVLPSEWLSPSAGPRLISSHLCCLLAWFPNLCH